MAWHALPKMTIGTTANTLAQLAYNEESVPCSKVRLKAGVANSGTIYVSENKQGSSTHGWPLSASGATPPSGSDETPDIEVDDLNKVWIIGSAASQIVWGCYWD